VERIKMLRIEYAYDKNIFADFPYFYKEDVAWYSEAEKNTHEYFISKIKPEFSIIDAGAQIGMYSVLFSKLAVNGMVYSFEPTDTIDLLEKNLQFNNCNNVETLKLALSNKDGEFEDKIYKQWSQKLIEHKKFNFCTLDTFVRQRNILVDLIKIDVDSYDFEVLLGSKELLSKQSPIVMVELNNGLEIRGYKLQEVIQYMNSLNYFVETILDNENYIFKKA
jgi:FkbM family methyltransferase